ncbi:hypothetical protein SUGI_1147060 [Cryptomeria japonica]|uniref:uncharacterized protein LOC131069733 n=1 Tax=Cryptomeria japonica TaxID=3369 RepID=UPI0024146D3C|nr:uncharacterized protein LOC131069733 [Cryptomeria japonica]GLJ53753.1 hypothetical protein SUGI_1147060 [Cryptomeria japonica]
MGIAKLALLLAKNNSNHLLKSIAAPSYGYLTRTIATNAAEENPPNNIQEEGLGARLSFVVQALENIQKQKTDKLASHEKLRAWRERHTGILSSSDSTSNNTSIEGSVEGRVQIEKDLTAAGQGFDNQLIVPASSGEIVHPWPEWIDLIERLAKQRYFDKTRFRKEDEDYDILENLSAGECSSSVSHKDDENLAALNGDFDVFKDINSVRKAFLDFGRDRYDILRSLSRKDIQILVGFGCPSLDKKVVLSGKRLRAYVHLDEGDVCSSCKLRNSCVSAYISPSQEDFEARTMDVTRILMIYGLDPLINKAENKLHKKKAVKTAICRLLKEIFRLSAIPLDPNFPKPVFKRPPSKVKEPQPPPRKRVGRDDVEMKKGDWLCLKCDFLNFAKNNVCLQCEAERPKRLLNIGEWECPGCNFLNYRRNMTCYNCDRKRPEDEYTKNVGKVRDDNNFQQSRYPNARLERTFNMTNSMKAWNDDFDDDESDGADVAAFEYGDSSKSMEAPLTNVSENRRDRCYDDDSFDFDNLPMRGRERVKGQKKMEGRKTEQHVNDWKMDVRLVSPIDRVKAFNDFGDFDEDEEGDADRSSLNRVQSRSYKRENTSATYSRRNERDYDSDEHLKDHKRMDSKSFRRPLQIGSSKEIYDSSVEEDDDDSFESESDDEPMKWKNNNKGRSVGRRGGGAWNKTAKGDSFEADPYDSDDEDQHLSRKSRNRDEVTKFTGRDASVNSRGRKGFRDDFEHDHGAKRNLGNANGRKGVERNWNEGGQDSSSRERQHNSNRGETMFGPRVGGLNSDTGYEDERRNQRNYGKNDGFIGSRGKQNSHSRNRHDFSKESPRSGRESSHGSRRGRMQNNYDFDEPDKERYNGRTNESQRKGKSGMGQRKIRGKF